MQFNCRFKSISTTIYKETQVLLTPFCYSIDFHHCPLFQPYRSSIFSSFTNILYFFLSIPIYVFTCTFFPSPSNCFALYSIMLSYFSQLICIYISYSIIIFFFNINHKYIFIYLYKYILIIIIIIEGTQSC